jgi:hypothetical protein
MPRHPLLARSLLLIAAALLGACAQVPVAAIDVNRQVGVGITTLGSNGQDLVNAWEETAFAVIDERWSRMYGKAEADFRARRRIAADAPLTAQQQEDLAGLATLVRDQLRQKISARANEMRKVLATNTRNTQDANESITQLLISANTVLTQQQSALKQVGEQLKIPGEVGKFMSDLVLQP